MNEDCVLGRRRSGFIWMRVVRGLHCEIVGEWKGGENRKKGPLDVKISCLLEIHRVLSNFSLG